MSLSRFIPVVLFLITVNYLGTSLACMCAPDHPQSYYCKSDFVIIATPKNVFRSPNGLLAYKLKIRNQFKMSEKAKLALKSGRLFTSDSSSMCGIELPLNRTYLITGRIYNLQARVGLCDFVKPWKDVNPRQRKGFKMLYKEGCSCKIQRCTSVQSCRKTRSNACSWLFRHNGSWNKCQADYGICFSNANGSCHWGMARKLTNCLHSHSLTHNLREISPRI